MCRPATAALLASAIALLLSACHDNTGPSGPSPSDGAATLSVGGHHACRLLSGQAVCWGRADAGQLGIDSTPLSAPATPVSAGGQQFVSIAAGGLHTCALTADGAAWCWGQNGSGQSGFPLEMNQVCGDPIHGWRCLPTPHPLETTLRFKWLAAGGANTCGLATDDAVYCWGSNAYGQLGDRVTSNCGATTCSWAPVRIEGDGFATIAVGSARQLCALKASGEAYCWGSNEYGELGTGMIGGQTAVPSAVVGGHRFRAIAVGGQHTCAIDFDGQPWCWGGDVLPLGDDGVSRSGVPVRVAGSPALLDIITGTWAACGRTSGGGVYCWGINGYGEMGIQPSGLNTRFDTAQRMSTSVRWEAVGGEVTTFCGVDGSDGTWCWGFGVFGELGPLHQSSADPVRIEGV